MDDAQTPAPKTVIDCAPTEAQGRELTPRHDTVLGIGEATNRPINFVRPEMFIHDVEKSGLTGHGGQVDAQGVTAGPTSVANQRT